MSTSDIFQLAISFTIIIRKSANPVAIIPNTNAAVGSRAARTIFKKPMANIVKTSGKTNTVQTAGSG